MNCKQITTLLAIVTLILLSACHSAPISERNAANTNIEKARSVDASKHASYELGIAEEHYNMGEDNIVENKKSGKNKKAFEAYTNANQSAKKAYDKSVGPYVTEKVESLATKLDEEIAYDLDKKSPEQFNKAESFLEKSERTLAVKKYDDTVIEVKQGLTSLEEAFSNAEYYEVELVRMQDEVDELIALAEEEKAAFATPEIYLETLTKNDDIIDAVETGFYEEALEEQSSLLSSIDEMLEIIEEKRSESARELEIANDKINTAEKTVAESNNPETSDEKN